MVDKVRTKYWLEGAESNRPFSFATNELDVLNESCKKRICIKQNSDTIFECAEQKSNL